MKRQRTYYPKPPDCKEKWYLVDVENQVLGRVATRIASIVRGKESPSYHPSVDTGHRIVVINADKVRVTGKKETDKIYYRHSGYPGGLKQISYRDQMEKDSRQVIMHAVKGMLPHNSLGRQLLTKVRVFSGPEHVHEAQSPVPVAL
ncbi:MAG: 50S ribosomal protein L13 [Flavobacteriales bacterium]|nr:50S ribosomal protein L13 [Flavobacteriales bacterium]